MFAWKQFLEARGVAFREAGRYEVVVHCPFCGQDDPSQHLSISLRGRGWRCLRNQAHVGKRYARLLSALIGCGEEQAREILGEATPTLPAADAFAETWRRQLGVEAQASVRPRRLDFPAEVKAMTRSYGRLASKFWEYLYDRGYTTSQAGWLAKTYRLQYSITGKWSYRILIPIYASSGALMTWTARSILPDAEVRYKTLMSDDSVESAPNLLLGLDFLWHVPRSRCLVVVEGPFDAMAVSALGNRDGIWGTCLFGVQVSDAQAALLADLSRRFESTRLLVDPDARMKVLAFRDRLPRGCEVRDSPTSVKDPGELPTRGRAGEEFVRSLAL